MKIEARRRSESGAASVYWIIVILIAMELMFFSNLLLRENVEVAIRKEGFLEKKTIMENLSEQTKLRCYLIMEKSVINARDYVKCKIEKSGNRYSKEDLERIYEDRLEQYLSRPLKIEQVENKSEMKRMDIAYIEGHSESYETGYEYSDKGYELDIAAESVSEKISEHSKNRRNYIVKYTLNRDEDGKGYSLSNMHIIMDYPSYEEAVLGRFDIERVRVLKGTD